MVVGKVSLFSFMDLFVTRAIRSAIVNVPERRQGVQSRGRGRIQRDASESRWLTTTESGRRFSTIMVGNVSVAERQNRISSQSIMSMGKGMNIAGLLQRGAWDPVLDFINSSLIQGSRAITKFYA